MTELKPCPFCGYKVQYNYNADFEPAGIVCMNCHTMTKFMRIEVKPSEKFEIAMDKMADTWNRRTNGN